MRSLSFARSFRLALAPCVVAAALVSAAAAPAAATGWKVQRSPNPSSSINRLNGVAATSATNAWAVGVYDKGYTFRTLIERWNGKVWKVQPSANPGGSSNNNYLSGVAAISARDAWAVGYYSRGKVAKTLIEHWNGTAWTVQPSAPRGRFTPLAGVAATSTRNAWAVGSMGNTLIERWNGKVWKVEPSADPDGSYNSLFGAAAVSSTDAWAVGSATKGSKVAEPLIERRNGQAWKLQPGPKPSGSYSELYGVAATSATSAWAVGSAANTLIEHWNGKAWKVQPSPARGDSADLTGVAAISAKDAWAVGNYSARRGGVKTLIVHWNAAG